jgi:hypothetical protein
LEIDQDEVESAGINHPLAAPAVGHYTVLVVGDRCDASYRIARFLEKGEPSCANHCRWSDGVWQRPSGTRHISLYATSDCQIDSYELA